MVTNTGELIAITHTDAGNVVEERAANGSVVKSWTTRSDVVLRDPGGGPVRLVDLRSPCADRYRGSLIVHWSTRRASAPMSSCRSLNARSVITLCAEQWMSMGYVRS